MIMMDVLIEEAAKAIFFRDMVNGKVPQSLYDVWDFDTEPNASTGEKVRVMYQEKAKKHLAAIGAI